MFLCEITSYSPFRYSSDVVNDDDIDDLETPISTGNYFDNLKDLKVIKEVVGTNADESG